MTIRSSKRFTQASLFAVFVAVFVFWTPIIAFAGNGAVKIFAHRGVTVEQPENSLAALKAAMDLGLDGSEVDLRTTADGAIVLMHDSTLERTTNGRGAVEKTSLADLGDLRLKNQAGRMTREKIPTLGEALALVSQKDGFVLALDIKAAEPETLGRVVLESGCAGQVIFCLRGPDQAGVAKALKAVSPQLRVSMDLLDWWRIEGLATFAKQALDLDALFASEWYFPRYGFREARDAGAEVMVYLWGLHDLPSRGRKALLLGADSITCDRPAEILFLRNEKRPAKGGMRY